LLPGENQNLTLSGLPVTLRVNEKFKSHRCFG
jgi:hypothetical protein